MVKLNLEGTAFVVLWLECLKKRWEFSQGAAVK